MSFFTRKYAWSIATLALIAGCGGSEETPDAEVFDTLPAKQLTVRFPVQQWVNQVAVQAVDFPDRDLPVIDMAGGSASVDLPSDLDDSLLILRAGRRDEAAQAVAQQEGTTIDTPQGPPARIYSELLLTGAQLQRMGASFNPLGDYISRRTNDYVELLTNERIRHYQDQMAAQFITQDLTGDGHVDFDDALVFDPSNALHRGRLSFNYEVALHEPLPNGHSLARAYSDFPDTLHEDLTHALEIYEGISPPSSNNNLLATVHIDVDAGGSVRIDEMPQLELNESNPRFIHRYERTVSQGQQLTLHAQAQEGWKLVRWAGCPAVQSDNSCRIALDEDVEVSAQFGLLEHELVDGVAGVIEMDKHGQSVQPYAMEYSGNTVLIRNVTDPALRAALNQAVPTTVLARKNRVYPLQQIEQVLADSVDGAWRFAIQHVEPTEVYTAFSAFDAGEVAQFEDVEHISIAVDGETDASHDMLRMSPLRQVTWIPGLGRALPAGHGYYLVDGGADGFKLVRSQSQVQTLQGTDATQSMALACAENPQAPDCVQLARQAGLTGAAKCRLLADVLPTSDLSCNVGLFELELEAKVADTTLVGKFSLEANLSVKPYGSMSFRWMPLPVFPFAVADFSSSGRGVVDFTLGSKAFVGLGSKSQAFKEMGTPKIDGLMYWSTIMFPSTHSGLELASMANGYGHVPAIQGPAEAAANIPAGQNSVPVELKRFSAVTTDKKSLLTVSMLLNTASPAGVVFPVKIKASIVAETTGAMGLELKAAQRVRFFYDMDADIGAKCKKVLVTLCYGIKIPQRVSGNVKVKSYQKFSAGLVANGEIAPGIKIQITAGPRTIAEELLSASAGVSVPIYAVGQVLGFAYSNFPEDALNQIPTNCGVSGNAIAFGIDFKVSASAVIQPALQFKAKKINVTLKLLPNVNIFSWEDRRPILPATLRKFMKSPDGVQYECMPVDKRPARYVSQDHLWKAGDLNWDQLTQKLTTSLRLIREDNGRLALYALTRADDRYDDRDGGKGRGAVSSQKELWSSGITDHPGSRIAFEKKTGQLVVYDLREKKLKAWPDKPTANNPESNSLHMHEQGYLEILDASGKQLWRSNSPPKK